MSKTNNFVFWGLYVIAWLIFVGLSIEAGGLIVNFVVSLYRPEFIPNLYQKLDLTHLYASSRPAFYGIYSFILVISILKALLFYLMIRLMHTMDLSKPFTAFVARQIAYVSYLTVTIGLLGYIARQTAANLSQNDYLTNNLDEFWTDSQAFILMAAVVYVIATIFKKGVEIQTDNDLTV